MMTFVDFCWVVRVTQGAVEGTTSTSYFPFQYFIFFYRLHDEPFFKLGKAKAKYNFGGFIVLITFCLDTIHFLKRPIR
jgi:hypothetical protein